MAHTNVRQVPKEALTNRVTPQFLLRVGGLPITMLDKLRFERTTQWVDSVLELESALTARKEGLVNILHEAVSTYKEDQALRRKLINFKRHVFNMRLTGNPADARLTAHKLSPEGRDLLNEWLDLCDRHQEIHASGIEILRQELDQKRASLKAIISIPDFRKGVLLSSPILDDAVDAYIDADNLRLNRESRTVEHSLLEYLFRTACKTSPFSTFTSVSFGEFELAQETGTQDIDLAITSMEKQSFTRLNMLILSRLSTQLMASPAMKQIIPVRLTPGWRVEDDRVIYMRRKTALEGNDEERAAIFDIIQENIIQLPMGSMLYQLLELMKDGHEERLGDIVTHLCSQGHLHGLEEEVERYLQHLLRLNLLIIPALQLDIHKDRPLTEFRKGLYTIAIPRLDTLADDLGEIEVLVDAYATASLSLRREILTIIKQKIKQCYTNLGQSQTVTSLPKTLLYEDTTIKPQRLAVSSPAWQVLLDHTSELQSLLPVFDVSLPAKFMMRGYFQGRYGAGQRCDDLLSFADTYNQDFLQLQKRGMPGILEGNTAPNVHENQFNLPELDKLNEARQEVASSIRQAYAKLSPGAEELILGDDFLAAVTAHIPQNTEAIQSHAFFSQFANVNHEPLLIINQIYSGLTLMFSRFAYCFTDEFDASIAAKLRTRLRQLQPPGAVIAELKGGYEATNLNLHPIVTPYELVCPGELSMRPIDEQIPLEDLFIQDDVQTGRLRLYSKRLGKEVIPLYLGFLVPLALPEIQQILLNFSPMTRCSLDLWSGTGIVSETDTQRYYPRLRYKNIVLRRAVWQLDPRQLPQREPGQSDADFFLSVARWRKALGLPSKVFISPDLGSPVAEPADDKHPADAKKAAASALRSYKPLYIDFENYFSVFLLEAALRNTHTGLQVTEMLPGHDHLWFQHGEDVYVSEFVFEMSHIKGENDAELD